MAFLNQDGDKYTSAKDDGTGNPITAVSIERSTVPLEVGLNNDQPLNVNVDNTSLDVNITNTASVPVLVKNTAAIKTQVQKSYSEFVVTDADTVATGATKSYTVDLIDSLGVFRTYGVAMYTTQTDSSNSKVLASIYSVPKNIPFYSATTSGNDNAVLFNSIAFVQNYPLQKQLTFTAPKIHLTVKAAGTVDLTGLKIVVWGME
ncbi:hypothetical protein MKX81_06540 [Bacillus sp. FSL R7-0718]|uniref:hypothetical protein n=1 Tax=Bacillus TaxID=1386 RepID=UPI0026DF9A79|nr:hypothetical protein [Bacillus subtilis]MCL8468023.1 hypothetical protein [Bacillus subtilis]MCM3008509.1 hypothetical protein [Bacillus subtilis]MDK8206150.1 hypothetical protein [Bacillus subtilis]MEC3664160.1 hypothetical protein [Bacillus subtilis]